jgi:hypothetical protein
MLNPKNQRWPAHQGPRFNNARCPMNIRSGYLLHVDVDPVHNVFLESHQPATLVCTLEFTFRLHLERFR